MSRGRFGRGSWHENSDGHIHVKHWHTINYNRKTKTDICQEGRKSFTYPIKKQGRKQKYWNTSQTAVWSAQLKYSNRDMKKTPETMSPFAVMNMVWSDEGIKKSSGDAEHLRLMNMIWSDEGMKKTKLRRNLLSVCI